MLPLSAVTLIVPVPQVVDIGVTDDGVPSRSMFAGRGTDRVVVSL